MDVNGIILDKMLQLNQSLHLTFGKLYVQSGFIFKKKKIHGDCKIL